MDMKRMREANRNRQMASKLVRKSGFGAASGGGQASGAEALAEKFNRGILSGFQPGNIGDINQVIWPFMFLFESPDIAPGQSLTTSFSVSQEAGFLWRSTSAQVFRKTGPDYSYIDPFLADESINSANGLVFGFKDAQSSREFNGRALQDISTLGNANFPSVYPSTIFLLPNQTMQIILSNQNATETFKGFVTVTGYRVRVPNAQQILSTVTG
jgi:hypothetical protein